MAKAKRIKGKTPTHFPQSSIVLCKEIFEKAQHLHQTGLITEAEKLYKDILNIMPDNPDCLHYLGLIYFQKGNDSKAESHFKKSIKYSNNPIYFSNYALLQRKQLKFNDALKSYKKAIDLNPKYAEAWYNLGITHKDLGDYEAAEQAYKKAISLKSDYIKALHNLAVIQELLGNSEEAHETMDKVQAISPNNYQLYQTMGIAMQHIGGSENIKKALNYFKQALELEPYSLETLIALARLQKDTNKPETALKIYNKILSIEPEYHEIRIEHADCLVSTGQIDLAEQELLSILQYNPDNISVMLSLGHAANIKGDFIKAEATFNEVLIHDKYCSGAYAGLASCKKYTEDDMEFINQLKASAENEETANIFYALGKVYNDISNYDASFKAYAKANEIRNKRIEYDKDVDAKNVDQMIEVFNKELIENKKAYGHESEIPIFVLGTPRSGTTLTEQIISSHPQVFGAGELKYIAHLVERDFNQNHISEKYPKRIESITEDDIRSEAEAYLEKINAHVNQNGILRITDKMPGNFMHIGYILMLFPKAKIIHCKRNPLDACISMFFQNFVSRLQYTFNLENLGYWYKQYIRMMQHWNLLYGDRIFEVEYDDTVNETEVTARKLIDYCGLEWSDQCIEFYKTKRNVRTASLWQVRQPIYKTSLQRWKRYDKHIDVLKEILAGYY